MTLRTNVAVALLLTVAFSGCAAPETGSEGEDPYKLGALLPLSLDGASFGEPALKGIRLAVEEKNAAGGIGGRMVEVHQGDTRFPNTQEAVASMQRLVGEGVQFVIGATASDSSAAAKQIANENQVILMSPGSTRPSLTGPDHGYFFRTIASDAVQGPQAAQFAFEDLGHEEAVVMYEQTAYGRGLQEQFMLAYAGLGGEILGSAVAWEHDETTYDSKAAEATDGAGDLIWIAGQAPHIANLIQSIRDQGYDGTILTSEAVENPSIFDVASDAVDGVLFTKSGAGLGSPEAQAFDAAYRERWGEAPGVFSAFAYDAAYVAFAAFEAVGEDGAAIKAWLEQTAAVPDRVTTDTIRFNANGDVTTGGYALWQVDSGAQTFKPYET